MAILPETTMREAGMTESGGLIRSDALPSVLEHMEDLKKRLRNKRPVVFIDYDGTLTPIVDRPERADLPAETRRVLRVLSDKCPVAIVSGRDLADVRNRVAVEKIHYAGSHGFEIAGPDGQIELQQGRDCLPSLDQAEKALRQGLASIPCCQIERKRFAIAVHFRRAAADQFAGIAAVVNEVAAGYRDLRRTGGKMILELRPAADWDKGRALQWILRQWQLGGKDVLPLYLGDDLTDEDAFRCLRRTGVAILVRDEVRPTAAHYAVENPDEVQRFLQELAVLLP
jgi:trehalose-phosphatase